MSTQNINERIWHLWHDNQVSNSHLTGPHLPKFYCDPKQRVTVLFLGLNPSFPDKINDDLHDEIKKLGLHYKDDFNWDKSGLNLNYDRQRATTFAHFHTLGQKLRYPFFQRLQELATHCGQIEYQVIDLFLRLEANSRLLPEEYWKARNHRFNSDQSFIRSQLDICYDQVATIQPRCIVGVYAGASDIFLKYYKSRHIKDYPKLRKARYENVCPKLFRIDLPTPWQKNSVPFFKCNHLPLAVC